MNKIQNSNGSAFISRLEEFLNSKNVTIQQLADLLGYASPQKIYRLFNTPGAYPSIHIVTDISNKYLDLNLNWLFMGIGKATITKIPVSDDAVNLMLRKEVDFDGSISYWLYSNNKALQKHGTLEKAEKAFNNALEYYKQPTHEVIRQASILPSSVHDFASALGEELAGL